MLGEEKLSLMTDVFFARICDVIVFDEDFPIEPAIDPIKTNVYYFSPTG